MHKLWTSKCSQIKTCLQRDSNSRPLLYESSALPLSYRGLYNVIGVKKIQNLLNIYGRLYANDIVAVDWQ